jgi:DNA polymerase-3 subunit alpha
VNKARFSKIKNNPHYLAERDALREIPDGQEYYEYVIKNVELDPSNSQNSYIMWVYEKVDELDMDSPCKFVEANYSLPDIDVDFPPEYRQEAIDYVVNKYGEANTCQIVTFSRMMGKSAVRAVMQAEGGYPMAIIDSVTENIPDEAKISDQIGQYNGSVLQWVLHEAPKLVSDYVFLEDEELQGEYADVFRKALKLEGTYKSKGKHAAGFIISSVPIDSLAPMDVDKHGDLIAGLDMGDLEQVGLVKFDFLGVDILSKVQEVLGSDLSIYPLSDAGAFEVLHNGNTKGCFQLENRLGSDWCKSLKPNNIDQISDVISLIRPGSLHSKEDGKNMPEHYKLRKFGEEGTPRVNDIVDKILKPTYGIIVYQEQAMRVCRAIAGFTMSQANKLRKAAGKKNASLMEQVKTEFMAGCLDKGVDEDTANYIFNMIESSNRYSFNASHGVSYSYLSYYSAYAKKHKPLEFYRTWLNHAKNKIKPFVEVQMLCMSAKIDKVEILPPSAHYKETEFFIHDDAVVYGLRQVKGASKRELEKLFELMVDDYDYIDYLHLVFPNVNKRTVEALIDVGGFDYLGKSRSELKHLYSCLSALTDKEREWIIKSGIRDIKKALLKCSVPKKEGGGASTKRRTPKILDILDRIENPGRDLRDNPSTIAQREESLMGVALSVSYMDACTTAEAANTTCKEFADGKGGKMILVVRVKEAKEHTTKNGDTMAFLTVEDDSCQMEMVVFSKEYEEFSSLLYPDSTIVVVGERSKKGSFVASRIVEA